MITGFIMDGKRLMFLAVCYLVIIKAETKKLANKNANNSAKIKLDKHSETSSFAVDSRSIDTYSNTSSRSSDTSSKSNSISTTCRPENEEDCAEGEFCAPTCDEPKCFPCPCAIVPDQCILVYENLNFEAQCNCEGSGFFGSTCQYDINECEVPELNNCDMNATCTNTNGSFYCTCRDGFSGSGQTCNLIDPCLVSDINDCDENAQCQNGDSSGNFDCVCNEGYVGDGRTCVELCGEVICDALARCIDDSYCKCNEGFLGSGLPGDCTPPGNGR